jgi:RNA polymerase sigma-70 factor (ECF subfamily)
VFEEAMSVTAPFSQLLVEMIPRLRRFARSLTRSAADADDIAQAAIERALVHQASWKPGTRLDSWVFRIAQNLWRDELRAHRRRAEPLDGVDLPGEDGRESFLRHIEVSEVADSFHCLTEEQRLVLTLVVLEGFSYQEAAAVLEVPVGTVMSRLARARGRLAARMPAEAGRLRAAT